MLVSVKPVKIDTVRLNKVIDEFEVEHNKKPYLIMNENTFDDFINSCEWSSLCPIGKNPKIQFQNGRMALYLGNKVFCDSDIEDGYVEVR